MSTDNFEDDLDLHALLTKDVRRNLDGIAADLRRLADRVDATNLPAAGQPNPDFGNVVSMVVADVMNMMPNLGLSALVRAAAAADTSILLTRKAVASTDLTAEVPAGSIGVGSTVYDVVSGDQSETGVVTAVHEDGYTIVWDLGPGVSNGTGVYADAIDVALVDVQKED